MTKLALRLIWIFKICKKEKKILLGQVHENTQYETMLAEALLILLIHKMYNKMVNNNYSPSIEEGWKQKARPR